MFDLRLTDGSEPGWQGGPHRRRALAQAEELYRDFTHRPATRVFRVRHPRVMPPVVVALGELVGVIYRSDKGAPGQPQNYIHFMEDPPRLVSDLAGRQLYLVGGSYRITNQGIEG